MSTVVRILTSGFGGCVGGAAFNNTLAVPAMPVAELARTVDAVGAAPARVLAFAVGTVPSAEFLCQRVGGATSHRALVGAAMHFANTTLNYHTVYSEGATVAGHLPSSSRLEVRSKAAPQPARFLR